MTRATDACDRLAQTRGQLRLAIRAMVEPVKPPTEPPSTGWVGSWWRRLKATPGTRVLVQGVTNWAAHSPLPGVALFAVDALTATVRPIAQRSPLRLVFGAFVLGGVFAWSRPWRRVFTPALVAAVLPQLMSQAIGGVPRSKWMTLIASLMDRR